MYILDFSQTYFVTLNFEILLCILIIGLSNKFRYISIDSIIDHVKIYNVLKLV